MSTLPVNAPASLTHRLVAGLQPGYVAVRPCVYTRQQQQQQRQQQPTAHKPLLHTSKLGTYRCLLTTCKHTAATGPATRLHLSRPTLLPCHAYDYTKAGPEVSLGQQGPWGQAPCMVPQLQGKQGPKPPCPWHLQVLHMVADRSKQQCPKRCKHTPAACYSPGCPAAWATPGGTPAALLQHATGSAGDRYTVSLVPQAPPL